MIAALNELAALAQAQFAAAFLVFVRIGAALALLPAFGEMTVPMRVRLAAAVAFSLLVFPLIEDGLPTGPQALTSQAGALMGEAGVGLAMGAALRISVAALQIAGTMIAQSTSLSQLLGAGGEPQPAIAQLLLVSGLALAVQLGLHVRLVEAFVASYAVIPPGGALPAGDLARWAVAHVAHSFSIAFSLALPFVIASLLFNAMLGIVNRAMPQLMVAFVGAPALTAGGLALLALLAPALTGIWLASFDATLGQIFEVPK
ncbi:MAG: flagellar biosynthetic protein FliR [Paracoccaceae bacterium]